MKQIIRILMASLISLCLFGCAKLDDNNLEEFYDRIQEMNQTDTGTNDETEIEKPNNIEGSSEYLNIVITPKEFGSAIYTVEEIKAMKGLSAEELQKKISTLPDMIQYVIENDFSVESQTIGDFQYISGDYLWHINRTPQMALDLESGSCGSISNLARYILEDDFDAEGYIMWGNEDPIKDDHGGHIFNYFEKDGIMYTFDFTGPIWLKRMGHGVLIRNFKARSRDELIEKINEFNSNPLSTDTVHTVFLIRDTKEDHPPTGQPKNSLSWFIDKRYEDELDLLIYNQEFLETLDYFTVMPPIYDAGFDPETIPYEDLAIATSF